MDLKTLANKVLERDMTWASSAAQAWKSVPASHAHTLGQRDTAQIARVAPNETEAIWDAEDWRAFFEERAAIAEHDGGLRRLEADARAYECCIVEWLDRHTTATAADRCAHCGRPEAPSVPLLPFGTKAHAWLHARCWLPWYAERRRDARHGLSCAGINRDPAWPIRNKS